MLGDRPLTEHEQGEELCRLSESLESCGWAGGIITSWQDVWSRRNWNTAFMTMTTNSYLWHDLQTENQGRGLMAFLPGAEPVCTLDGRGDEWTEKDLVLQKNGMSLYGALR